MVADCLTGEFLGKGVPFVSVGIDPHHILTQATGYVKDLETISKDASAAWTRRPTKSDVGQVLGPVAKGRSFGPAA